MLNASIGVTVRSCGMRYGVVRDGRNARRDGVADIEYSWQYGTDEGNQELAGARLLYAHPIWVRSQGHTRLAIRPVYGSTTLAAPNYRPFR